MVDSQNFPDLDQDVSFFSVQVELRKSSSSYASSLWKFQSDFSFV